MWTAAKSRTRTRPTSSAGTASRKVNRDGYLGQHGCRHRHRQHRQQAPANFAVGGLDFLLADRDQDAARKLASDWTATPKR
jgi:hypothetical protein